MRNKLLEIINYYGVIPQLKYFQSEVFELNEAIIKHETAGCEYQHIIEEIADVMVMLEQFKLYYDISSEEVTEILCSKVDRQI